MGSNVSEPRRTRESYSNHEIRHICEENESISSIAEIYHLRIEDLHNANPELNDHLPVGTEVYIPRVPIDCIQSQLYHVLEAGETLFTLSTSRNIPLQSLEEWNPHVERGFALPGFVIYLSKRHFEKQCEKKRHFN